MEKEYSEMLAFMREFASTFQLRVIELTCGFKQGLTTLIGEGEGKTESPMKAMFMGTRRDDPDGKNQTSFSPTDASWPSLVRVNPILGFHYHDIWEIIRIYGLPYCELYNRGFTSIGSVDDTTTNELLWIPFSKRYARPWHLSSGKYERLGRGCRQFFVKWGCSSFLAYPTEILQSITRLIHFPDLIRLYTCGCSSLNQKILHNGTTEVSFIENTLLPSSFNFKMLEKLSSVTCAQFTLPSAGISPFSAYPSAHVVYPSLPSSLQTLKLAYPRMNATMTQMVANKLLLPNLTHLRIESNPLLPLMYLIVPSLRILELLTPNPPWELIEGLTNLEKLSFIMPPSLPYVLSLPKTLQTLQFKGDPVQDLSYLGTLPPQLTSLIMMSKVPNTIFSMLPTSLKELLVQVSYQPDMIKLPPTLENLRLHFLQFPITSVTPRLPLSSLPASLRHLRVDSGRFLELDPNASEASWPPHLETLHIQLDLTNPIVCQRLPRGLKSLFPIVPGHGPTPGLLLLESIKMLPPGLTNLDVEVSYPVECCAALPSTLTILRCEGFCGDSRAAISLIPRSITSLSMIKQTAEHIMEDLPPKLNHLSLFMDTTFNESMIPLLPRSLTHLSIFSNNSTYGAGLSKLPHGLLMLIMPQASFSLEIGEIEQLLPRSLTQISFGKLIVNPLEREYN
jgi:hypothetical protein